MEPKASPNHGSVSELVAFWAPQLDPLPAGAVVGMIYLKGSLCPVTQAHALSMSEGRLLLLGHPTVHPLLCSPAPARCDAVIGLVSLNSDRHVSHKVWAEIDYPSLHPLTLPAPSAPYQR